MANVAVELMPGAALMKGGLSVEGGEAACARRRCQGRLGCICAAQERASRNELGPAGVRAKVVGAVAGNREGRANGRLGAGSSVSRAPEDPLDDFAVGIGVDLRVEPALRWLVAMGTRYCGAGAKDGRVQARGLEMHQAYYVALAQYCRQLLESAGRPDEDAEERHGAKLVQRRGRRSSARVMLNTSAGKSSRAILRLACAELGWEEEPCANGRGHIFWAVTENDTAESLRGLKRSQRLARIPGMGKLCEKRPFALLMRANQEREPDDFEFWPRTWVFPDDPVPKAAVFKRGTPLIWKPSAGGQGDGIVLLTSAEEVRRRLSGADSVLQRYLPAPLLLDGLKFDVRCYVLVASLVPLRVYFCRDGLVRLATQPYQEPTAGTKHQLNAHLTNYSINKYEIDFQHDDDPSSGQQGSKRSLRAVLAHLEGLGHDAEALERSMHAVVWKTCRAMAGCLTGEEPAMPVPWPPNAPGSHENERSGVLPGMALSQCFHVLGFDIMFCQANAAQPPTCHLLEVNGNPSLGIDAVFPIVGPHAQVPRAPPADAPWASHCRAAMEQLPYRGARQCLCRDHHRPHLHAPCAVDLVAKRAAVVGALTIVRRLMAASSSDADDLHRGTEYVPLP